MSRPGSCRPPVRRRGRAHGLCPKPHGTAEPGPPTGGPSSGLPETVLQVTLLPCGSGKILRADCADVTRRNAACGFCRSSQTRTPRCARPAPALAAFPARGSLEGTADGDAADPRLHTRFFPRWFRTCLSVLAPRHPECTPGFHVKILGLGFPNCVCSKNSPKEIFLTTKTTVSTASYTQHLVIT